MKNKIKLIVSLLKLVRPFLTFMLLAIILGVLGHLTATFITIFIILAICKVITFSLAVKLIILCAFSRGIFRYIEQACNHYIAFKVLAHIRHLVFEKLRELAPAKLENEDKGNIIAMLTSDVELLEVFFAHTISPVMIAFIYSIVMICFIGHYHLSFGIFSFICYSIMGILIPYTTYKLSQKDGSNYRLLFANYNTFVLETVLGKREIIQFSQQETRFEQMKKHQNDLTQTHQKLIDHQSFQQILSDGLIILSIVVSILLIKNNVSKELLIPMMALSSSFGPTIALANLANNLNQVFPCARRILDLLEEKPLLKEITDKNTTLNLPIEVKNLSFHYPNTSTEVLHKINYTFEFGKTYGLLGKSGCGKSTLLKLLMRIYQGEGDILFNNESIEEINSQTLKENIIYVDQETFLFKDTLYHNITLLNPNYQQEEVIKACKQAQIHDFIMSLPQGYRTIYDENISGGQKQRIGLARAFLRKTPILLLDEPTSALDPISTLKIEELLLQLKDQYTIAIVTHNMQQASRIADYTAFFLVGEMVEYGPTKDVFGMPKDKRTEDYITGRFG